MNTDVLIVGAGPAGLAAAIELRRLGAGRILVADREPNSQQHPRHSAHTGYGLRDLRRVITGPAYARHYARAAARAGAEIRAAATVTGWAEDRVAIVTSPGGIETVQAARAVLLATGCRERPRTARLVPGEYRPSGVMTTGELQQRVYLGGQRLPGRALVVGAEHVSFSAMVTLAHAGADVVALVTEQPRQQSYAAFALGAAVRWRVPVWTSTAIRLVGPGPADRSGPGRPAYRLGPAGRNPDTLVFTGDWIPDHEQARLAGTAVDPEPPEAGRGHEPADVPCRWSSRRATWSTPPRPPTWPRSSSRARGPVHRRRPRPDQGRPGRSGRGRGTGPVAAPLPGHGVGATGLDLAEPDPQPGDTPAARALPAPLGSLPQARVARGPPGRPPARPDPDPADPRTTRSPGRGLAARGPAVRLRHARHHRG